MVCTVLLGAGLFLSGIAAAQPASLRVWKLSVPEPAPPAAAVTSGALDARFVPEPGPESPPARGTTWLRVRRPRQVPAASLPVFSVDASSQVRLSAFESLPGRGAATRLPDVASFADSGGAQRQVFLMSAGVPAGGLVYLRVEAPRAVGDAVRLGFSTLPAALARAARRSLMIGLACGALAALALATALMWIVLTDAIFLYYASMTGLEALYLAYFSGEGFHWPLLAGARAMAPYAWDIPIALSGAMAYLFVREIAELRTFSPRVYRLFGWFAAAFAALAAANVARLVGLGDAVVAVGNLMFLVSGPLVLAVAFLAWRRGSSAAGWFLCAWVLLEAFVILATLRLLVSRAASNEALFYYWLPAAMVAAAVLTALGVADRLRLQRRALTEAEKRAQTDPLTGVLNRRSLLERLEALCRSARAQSLPITVLFIDLDFFKEINDTYGHAAGDVCLASLVAPIQAELRHSDIIGRYGGEEFVAVLSGADADAAQPIAERIRARVAEIRIDGFGGPIRFTCSIGVASSNALGGESLIAQADAAVYAAKRAGRNRVQLAVRLAA
jgi:diguanylate cyclase (GGDEF)-like protein